MVYGPTLFEAAAKETGHKPFPCPAANMSRPYTNPLGVQLAPCTYCGFCEKFGCGNYSKASAQTTILPVLLRKKNFELRTECEVMRIEHDATAKRATGVVYVDTQGQEFEQPAEMVIMCAYALHNPRLLLLSGIGTPYDPKTGQGVIGKNYAYQIVSGVDIFFDDKILNPFVGAGALGIGIDDYNGDNFDHSGLGFIGGGYLACWNTNGRPIEHHPVPKGTPKWGAEWKKAVAKNYLTTATISTHGAVMSHRNNYLDLDPTYRDVYGRPLMRMTFDYTDNEHKMSDYLTDRAADIAKAMKGARDPRQEAHRPLRHRALPDHAQYRRRHHGRRSEIERGQQLSAELGPAQFVRDGRLRLPAERRLQPDRHGGRSGLSLGRCDQNPISEKSRTFGAIVRNDDAQCADRFACLGRR